MRNVKDFLTDINKVSSSLLGKFFWRQKKLFLVMFFLIVSFISFSQANYLYKEKNWIFENSIRTGWSYSKSGKSEDGSVYYEYKHSDGSSVSYYFPDCIDCTPRCNLIIIADKVKRRDAYAELFDEEYTRVGFLKWGSKNENIFIEFDLDFAYMDVLFIKIRPMY